MAHLRLRDPRVQGAQAREGPIALGVPMVHRPDCVRRHLAYGQLDDAGRSDEHRCPAFACRELRRNAIRRPVPRRTAECENFQAIVLPHAGHRRDGHGELVSSARALALIALYFFS